MNIRAIEKWGRNARILLVCDPISSTNSPFDSIDTSEWESGDTLRTLGESWRALGFEVELAELSPQFFERWNRHLSSIAFVHSVVEGCRSLSRESWLPALCEMSGVPFIGSSAFSMALCMRKSVTKLVCERQGIPTAPWVLVRGDNFPSVLPSCLNNATLFLKPDAEGSGAGIDASHCFANSPVEALELARHLLRRFPEGVLIEKSLPGDEITTAIVGTRFLPVARIEVPTGVYGLSNKSKERMDEKLSYPSFLPNVSTELERWTRTLFRELDCSDFARFDFKCDDDGRFYFLEANPLAGLSYHYSVLPKMAEHSGLSYLDLLNSLALSAWERRAARSLKYGRWCLHGQAL